MLKLLRRLKLRVRTHFREVIKTKTTPHSIALGFALGTFLAILPTPGFSILLGFLAILFYKRISKYSLLAAMAFWNPITLIPIYYLSYRIGDFLYADTPIVVVRFVLLDQIYRFTRRFLIGNIILGSFFAVTSYFILKFAAKKYQNSESTE